MLVNSKPMRSKSTVTDGPMPSSLGLFGLPGLFVLAKMMACNVWALVEQHGAISMDSTKSMLIVFFIIEYRMVVFLIFYFFFLDVYWSNHRSTVSELRIHAYLNDFLSFVNVISCVPNDIIQYVFVFPSRNSKITLGQKG